LLERPVSDENLEAFDIFATLKPLLQDFLHGAGGLGSKAVMYVTLPEVWVCLSFFHKCVPCVCRVRRFEGGVFRVVFRGLLFNAISCPPSSGRPPALGRASVRNDFRFSLSVVYLLRQYI